MKVALLHYKEMFNNLVDYKDNDLDNQIKKDLERTKLISTDSKELNVNLTKQ